MKNIIGKRSLKSSERASDERNAQVCITLSILVLPELSKYLTCLEIRISVLESQILRCLVS